MAVRALQAVAKMSIGVGTAGVFLNTCLYNVDGGERGVVFDRFQGVKPYSSTPGTHFKIPFIEYPHIYDVRTRPRVINTVTGTKDLQNVNISLRVLSRPIAKDVNLIHKELGPDYEDRILPSITPEILKAVVAQYDAAQLLTQREQVSKQIHDDLVLRAADFHLQLDDVSITHLTFGKEFTQAIEMKQVAQQDAERFKFIVARTEQEKKAAVIRAEGESEAADLISKALAEHGMGVIEVRRIDAAKEIAETLSRNRNITYLPSNGNMLLGLNAGGQ